MRFSTATDSKGLPSLDLYGREFQQDPHAALRAARAAHWCAETPIGVAVLCYDEVQALLTDRRLRTPGAALLAMQGITEGLLVDTMNGFLLNTDGAAHDRIRRLVGRAFAARSVERFRARIRALAEARIFAMTGGADSYDFVAAFADPFAFEVLCEFVGIPAASHEDVHAQVRDIALMFGLSVQEHRADIERSLVGLHAYIDGLIEERRARPGDDLLSALVTAEEAGDLLTDAELRSLIVTLMSAGSDTATHQWGNAMAAFMAHPAQWRALAADPTLAATATEELIRFAPSVILGMPRVASATCTLRDRRLEPGECVLPITASANRDPRMFADPDVFDITRKARPHLTFGGGIHYCMGAALARAEFQEVLPLLARQIIDPAPAGPATWRQPTEAVYGPTSLPIRYRGA